MEALPTGTVTLLFSDIEGSTIMLSALGRRWAEALSAHREILRTAFTAHHGQELGTEGDSFFVAFESAREALNAAVEAQRGLLAYEWPDDKPVRVRMGIHTGEPQRHEDGYIGLDVHRAARIAAAAHGGQIVVSEPTRLLLGDLGRDLALRDLGWHRLKDLQDPEHLYDLIAPGLSSDFPVLRSLGTLANLPQPATPLIGRRGELAELRALLIQTDVRVLTLTGPGGTGKTRLAVAVAAAVEREFSHGVYFVPLHTADSAALMWTAIAEAVDATGTTEDLPRERVHRFLRQNISLIVLDNLEQIPDVDVVVGELLSEAPQVRVLATSRRPLHLVGEHEHPVPPLELPSDHGSDWAEAETSGAVELFVAHARMVRPSFTLGDANVADVVELCRRLDGLPLAIELAAARSKLLSPRALVSRLDDRLGSGVTASDRPARQRTIGATIAWSYELLDAAAQGVFRRLGAFVSSSDLDAVEAVAGTEAVDALDVVAHLVDASLVQVTEGSDAEPRISMLTTIRAFARERLDASGEADEVRLRHARWFADLAESVAQLLSGPSQMQARDRITLVEDDIRAALDWCLRPASEVGRDRTECGYRLLTYLSKYWYRFGIAQEGRAWGERGVAISEGDDSAWMVQALHGLGISLLQQNDVRAGTETIERSLAMAQRLGERALEAREYNSLAIAHRMAGDIAGARTLLESSVAIAREIGEKERESTALTNLAVIVLDAGDPAGAVRAGRTAVAASTALNDPWAVAVDETNLATALLRAEGPDPAYELLCDLAPRALALADVDLSVAIVEVFALTFAAVGDAEQALRLVGAADAQRETAGLPRVSPDQAMLDDALAGIKATISRSHWDRFLADGNKMSIEAALEQAAAARDPQVLIDRPAVH
jgi:predicted ATPase/class 3 adenylate cyclase